MKNLTNVYKIAFATLALVIFFVPIFEVHADTLIQSQGYSDLTEDASRASGSPAYPAQQFIAASSGTVGSIAVGASATFATYCTGFAVWDNSSRIDGGNSWTLTAVTGGYRYVPSWTWNITSGHTYKIVCGDNAHSGLNMTGTVHTPPTGYVSGSSDLGTTFVAGTAYGHSMLSWQISVCSDATCTLHTATFDTSTHIVELLPADGVTIATSSPITFSLHAYVNSIDFGETLGVQISLQSIDENSPIFDTNQDITIFFGQATTTGDFYVSTSTSAFPPGNYAVKASLSKTYFGIFANPISGLAGTQRHNFIYGVGTYLGSLDANFHHQISTILASTTATSTAVLAAGCSPFSGVFDIQNCLSYLFVPSAQDIASLWEALYTQVFQQFPLGYVTRLISLLALQTAVEPPALTYSFGSSSPAILQSLTLHDPVSFQIWDHVGSTSPIGEIRSDQGDNKSLWDIVDPYFTIVVGFSVFFLILEDLIGFSFSQSAYENENIQTRGNVLTNKEKRAMSHSKNAPPSEHFGRMNDEFRAMAKKNKTRL